MGIAVFEFTLLRAIYILDSSATMASWNDSRPVHVYNVVRCSPSRLNFIRSDLSLELTIAYRDI